MLRVDSPGGSVFGSELVRRELEVTRAAGKPVVVSMGNVAASGGYWISTASDEIVADAATITGSIGVFALLPTADQTLDKLGVHPAGVAHDVAAQRRRPAPAARPAPRRPGPEERRPHLPSSSPTKVAPARKTTPEKIDAVAQGRVWTGAQAKERGLVDTLGSFGDALALGREARQARRQAARRLHRARAGQVRAARRACSTRRSRAWSAPRSTRASARPLGVAPALVRGAARDLGWVADIAERRKPFAAVVHCLCGEPN